jgi:hypothetical protein
MTHINSYPQVSDGIAAIIRAFEKQRHSGLIMTRKDLGVFLDGLGSLHEAALQVETLADQAVWNRNARRERDAARRQEIEAGLADGKVALLPVIARPVPRPEEGGAA